MGTALAPPNTEASILSRMLDLRPENLTPAAAEFLLTIRFADGDIEQMNRLSELARDGTLSGAQEAELDSYVHVSNLLGLMQSRARKQLKSQAHGESGA